MYSFIYVSQENFSYRHPKLVKSENSKTCFLGRFTMLHYWNIIKNMVIAMFHIKLSINVNYEKWVKIDNLINMMVNLVCGCVARSNSMQVLRPANYQMLKWLNYNYLSTKVASKYYLHYYIKLIDVYVYINNTL